MKSINIREAITSDLLNIVVLKQQVWIDTYAIDGISIEFSNFVLNEFTTEKTLELLNDKNRIILLALSGFHLIGYIQVNLNPPSLSPETDFKPEIEVLYVLEKFCSKKIGTLLLSTAICELKKRNFNSVWLTVYSENKRAINFYFKKGFKRLGTTFFQIDENKYENMILKVDFDNKLTVKSYN